MLGGSLTALLGYLVPWFKQSDSYGWSYSGWGYASLSNGGGWTLMTFAWLLLAFVASLWAGRSLAAAMTGVVGAVGAAFFALAVVAASFASIPEQTNTNYITDLPVNIGLPLLAGGLGLLFAGGCRAVAVSVVRVGRQVAPQSGDAV